jgi:hypothetical protein
MPEDEKRDGQQGRSNRDADEDPKGLLPRTELINGLGIDEVSGAKDMGGWPGKRERRRRRSMRALRLKARAPMPGRQDPGEEGG